MVDPNRLLTILIPTYRRAGLLRSLLTAYAPVIARNADVCVVVSNSDPLHTEASEIAREFVSPQITYIQQAASLGPIIHLSWLIGQSTTPFTWLHSDDDMVEHNALDSLFEQLRRNTDIGLLYIPHLDSRHVASRNSTKAHEIYANFFPQSTLISTCIFRTKPLLNFISTSTRLSSYLFIPAIMAATSDTRGLVAEKARIAQGVHFSIGCNQVRKEIFLCHLIQETLQCNKATRDTRRACLIGLIFRSPSMRTYLIAVGMNYPMVFLHLMAKHPIIATAGVILHGYNSCAMLFNAICTKGIKGTIHSIRRNSGFS